MIHNFKQDTHLLLTSSEVSVFDLEMHVHVAQNVYELIKMEKIENMFTRKQWLKQRFYNDYQE